MVLRSTAQPKQRPATAPPPGRTGYRQIATELIGEIQQGTWPVGAKLPTESVLVARFGVSRNTVREALRELRDLGYVSKRRGTRSTVMRATAESSFLNSVRSVDEMLEYANDAHNTLLAAETVILKEEQARQLNCPPRSEWLRLQVLRRRGRDELPFCYSEVYVDPKYEDVVHSLNDGTSIYAAIEKRFGLVFGRVVQEIEAGTANENIALRLQVRPGEPILVATTYFYLMDGEPVEIGVAHFATGRYRLRMALDRRRGAQMSPGLAANQNED